MAQKQEIKNLERKVQIHVDLTNQTAMKKVEEAEKSKDKKRKDELVKKHLDAWQEQQRIAEQAKLIDSAF